MKLILCVLVHEIVYKILQNQVVILNVLIGGYDTHEAVIVSSHGLEIILKDKVNLLVS